MKITTLCFLMKEDKVLLAMKKRGFGVGKWNGVGGKVKEGEDLKAAAAREIKEEIGVEVAEVDLQAVGTLEFIYNDNPDWHQICNLFVVKSWVGEPAESEEMKPTWYAIDQIPFQEMWVDDPFWLPLILAGKKIKAKFIFDDNGNVISGMEVAELA